MPAPATGVAPLVPAVAPSGLPPMPPVPATPTPPAATPPMPVVTPPAPAGPGGMPLEPAAELPTPPVCVSGAPSRFALRPQAASAQTTQRHPKRDTPTNLTTAP